MSMDVTCIIIKIYVLHWKKYTEKGFHSIPILENYTRLTIVDTNTEFLI